MLIYSNKLRFLAYFCLVFTASKTFFNNLLGMEMGLGRYCLFRCVVISLSLILLVACDEGAKKHDAVTPHDVEHATDEFHKQHTEKSSSHSLNHDSNSAEYVGAKVCADCHQQQYEDWHGSHHDLAIQPANADTVLGQFDGRTFDYFGTTSTFYKKDDTFFVRTDGPDGKLSDYPIAYTFGVYPLQQYLIQFPKGRYQVLSIMWDARSQESGGQRWYHLYPDEHIKHNDELHWTGINHNWNYMCADCHSTNLHKNYDLVTQSYNTVWSELDVACEACHGPASNHIAWSESWAENFAHKSNQASFKKDSNKGFDVLLNERQHIAWKMDKTTGNAKRSQANATHTEIETCAQCHSLRATMKAGARPGHPLLENFRPDLLEPSLYHADGQIDGEVYVYGSFIQSKMYHAGVTCSDCHEPHRLTLRAEGNNLCAQCHIPDKYNSEKHHLHPMGTEGAACVNCHMPSKTYMGIDDRRDHSFRIPRPDLTQTLGVPNSCSQCHQNKPVAELSAMLEQHHGQPEHNHFAEAIHMGRTGAPGAGKKLKTLIFNEQQPAIARATAMGLYAPYFNPKREPQIVSQLLAMANNDSLLAHGLTSMIASLPYEKRPALATPLLTDPMQSISSIAASTLANVNISEQTVRNKLKTELGKFRESLLFSADRPESLLHLASLELRDGNVQQAQQYFQDAIHIAPYYAPAYINYADFSRVLGRDQNGEEILLSALNKVSADTPVHHALGLLYVRTNKMDLALKHLKIAAESESASGRDIYVYAVALHSVGKGQEAIQRLETALEDHPFNRDIVYGLVTLHANLGNTEQSQKYQQTLNALLAE